MSKLDITTRLLHGAEILKVDPGNIQQLLTHLQTEPCNPETVAHNLKRMSRSGNTYLAVATEAGRFVTGMTAINYNPIPSGIFGMIDDVVKLPEASGGTGRQLVRLVCNHAFSQIHANFVMLKSNQARVPARNMYTELGCWEQATDDFRVNSDQWVIDAA